MTTHGQTVPRVHAFRHGLLAFTNSNDELRRNLIPDVARVTMNRETQSQEPLAST